MIHLRIVAPEDFAHRALEVLSALARGPQRRALHGVATKPEGDVILCDVAREEASVILSDLKELEIPRRLDRPRAHRHLDLGRRRRGREGRARPALRRGRLGGGRAAHLREHRALVSFVAVHGARDADRRGRHPARPADPDRRRHGRRARVRPARRAVASRSSQRRPDFARRSLTALGVGFPAGIVARVRGDAALQVDRRGAGRLLDSRRTTSPASSPTRTSSRSSWRSSPGSSGCSRSRTPSPAR